MGANGPLRSALNELRRIYLPKLSEKGNEQRSDPVFCLRTEDEKDRKLLCLGVPSGYEQWARPRLFGQFLGEVRRNPL
jgi:hypothetical protein